MLEQVITSSTADFIQSQIFPFHSILKHFYGFGFRRLEDKRLGRLIQFSVAYWG
jgi:hypothetical protein